MSKAEKQAAISRSSLVSLSQTVSSLSSREQAIKLLHDAITKLGGGEDFWMRIFG